MLSAVINGKSRGLSIWNTSTREAFFRSDLAEIHGAFEHYRPTPLVELPALARRLGINRLFVKDESDRFGLKAFKVLGASCAMVRLAIDLMGRQEGRRVTAREVVSGKVFPPGRVKFCTATDGNHGRAVAFVAARLSQQAVIYMPTGSAASRVAAIRGEGAEVVIVDGTYDDAVVQAARDAGRNGWQIISDTSYSGYVTIPNDIMAGYLTIFREMELQTGRSRGPAVDIVFIQNGVGSLAAAAGWYYSERVGHRQPRLVSVEPSGADCFARSVARGERVSIRERCDTLMAGLNCGTPSLLAWPIVRDRFDLFLSLSDDYAVRAMRQFYYPPGNDRRITAGESGGAGLAGLLALLEREELRTAREAISLGASSRVLLINTEGDTDPQHFQEVVSGGG
jgi:diaminopropionate ammonia-lyase